MIKALLRKQLQEVGYAFFRPNKKTGKKRSKAGGIVLISILAAYLFLVFVGFSISMALMAREYDMEWGYYAILSIISLVLGVVGTAFNTYSSMYLAKDNEALLAMPIPPIKLLFVRLIAVLITCAAYSSVVYVPALLVGFILLPQTFVTVLTSIVSFLVILGIVLVLTCLLGWVIAQISLRLKNKSIITVLVALVGIALYFFVYMKMMRGMDSFFEGGEIFQSSFIQNAYPFYIIGISARGNLLATLCLVLITAAAVALTIFVLSRSFIKIVTSSYVVKNKKYTQEMAQKTKESTVFGALLRREYKHLLSSANYMLNCGLGLLIYVALAIAPWFFIGQIRDGIGIIEQEIGFPVSNFLPVLIMVLLSFTSTTICFTSATISLEGKTIWLLQTLPIPGKEVLKAKQAMQLYLTVPLGILCVVSLGIAFRIPVYSIAILGLFIAVFSAFISAAGLALNLKKNTLDWTNEAIPVKQSLPIFIMTMGSFAISLILSGAGFGFALILPSDIFVVIISLLLALFTWLLNRFIFRKGPGILLSL